MGSSSNWTVPALTCFEDVREGFEVVASCQLTTKSCRVFANSKSLSRNDTPEWVISVSQRLLRCSLDGCNWTCKGQLCYCMTQNMLAGDTLQEPGWAIGIMVPCEVKWYELKMISSKSQNKWYNATVRWHTDRLIYHIYPTRLQWLGSVHIYAQNLFIDHSIAPPKILKLYA